MIGKIIGAFAGSKLANSTRSGMDGPMGAAAGVAVATLAKRLSLPAMIALGAGGYILKKVFDKNTADQATPAAPVTGAPAATQPVKPVNTAI